MNIWHKRFLYLQIAILLLLAVGHWFLLPVSLSIIVGLFIFCLLEIGVLEAQRKELPEAVCYQKSCLFALVDLVSVFLFMLYTANMAFEFFSFDPRWVILLFLYIALRKLHILKHYSYIKN